MIRTFLAATFALAFTASAFASDIFNLQCDLAGKSGPKSYVFHFDFPTYVGQPRITWVTRLANIDLKYIHSDDKTISGAIEINDFIKMIGMPDNADTVYFRFYRITGDAEITYLQKPKTTDPHPPPSGFEQVMDEFTEKGTCAKVKPAF